MDLAAGQFFDRVAVLLGLPFPAGPHLEYLVAQCTEAYTTIPITVRGQPVSFSEPESHVRRMLQGGDKVNKQAVASGIQHCRVYGNKASITYWWRNV